MPDQFGNITVNLQDLIDAGIVEDPAITFARPEVKAAIKISAKNLSDEIDRRAYASMLRDLFPEVRD